MSLILFYFFTVSVRVVSPQRIKCAPLKVEKQRGTAFRLSWSITLFVSSFLFDLQNPPPPKKLHSHCTARWTAVGAVGFVGLSVCLQQKQNIRSLSPFLTGGLSCFLSARLLFLHCTRLSARGQSYPWLQPHARSWFHEGVRGKLRAGWVI